MNAAQRRQSKIVGSVVFLTACLGMTSSCASPASKADEPAFGGKGGGAASGGMATAGAGGKGGSSGASGSSGAGSSAAGGVGGAGGSGGAGGVGATGGSVATGGSSGSVATGGAGAAGGQSAAGGMSPVGGSNAGGAGGAAAGSGGSAGATGGGAGAAPTGAVENASADCEVGTLPEPGALSSIPKLPDPFMKLDGMRVASKAEWRCRRQEIRRQAEKYILGAKPGAETTTGTVTNTQVSVHVEAPNKSIDFTAPIVLPSTGTAPYPAVISVGPKGGLTMGEKLFTDQGVAVIYYNNQDLGKEGQAENSRGKPNPGKFYDIYGGDNEAGLLMSWAWGASRMLDVLQQSGSSIIDITGIGVTGCSRLGKGAFVIGVFDDRIALTIPQEPSTGGEPALRIMDKLPGGERTDYNYNGLNWLSENFQPFVFANNTSNAVKLPIDTHALIGMIAPRGVLMLENPGEEQMGAPAGHTAAIAALEIYKALGVEKNLSYHSAVPDSGHCAYKSEYTELLNKSIAAFLKHAGDPPGEILVGSGGSLTRSDWIDWTAPTLP